MAKWGEGDPRWIVEERADATNVNNWHWTEKNATLWSRDKLKDLLGSLKIENDEFSIKITEISKCEGEASANNRKAKLIFFYEWVIEGEWEGVLKNSDNKTKFKGKFEVPNLSEEHDTKDVDINITMTNSSQQKMKDFMRIEGATAVRAQFDKYISSLKEEFSKGIILPTKDSSGNLKAMTTPEKPKTTPVNPGVLKANTDNQTAATKSAKMLTKPLTMIEEFKCRKNELFQVFVDINLVKAFTQNSKCAYNSVVGGSFSLFDSNITGSFVEIVENKKIVMKWHNKRWPEGHFSDVTLEFNEKEDCAELTMTQTGVPANFVENTEEGWRNFYWNAIKQTFGYGSRLI